jgi:hypothetical protein
VFGCPVSEQFWVQICPSLISNCGAEQLFEHEDDDEYEND